MPVRLCAEPSCPEVATYRGRCAKHARTVDRKINRAGRKVYATARWRHTRERQLVLHPLCQCDDPACQRIATDVDHIQPLEQGGDPFSFLNLRSLAHGCHSRVTRAEQIRKAQSF